MVVVGIGRHVSLSELKQIASEPTDENVILVPDFNRFDQVAEHLIHVSCNGTSVHPNNNITSSSLVVNVVDVVTLVIDTSYVLPQCSGLCVLKRSFINWGLLVSFYVIDILSL